MLKFSLVKHTGFTLVELVTTIILIAILAVTALPRLFSQSSYSAYSLRNEFVSELRRVQQKALNNTDQCFRVTVTTAGYQELMVSRNSHGGACGSPYIPVKSLQKLAGGAQLALVSTNSQSFNMDLNADGSLALTPPCNGDCINVIADETVTIAISSAGYIYAN